MRRVGISRKTGYKIYDRYNDVDAELTHELARIPRAPPPIGRFLFMLVQ